MSGGTKSSSDIHNYIGKYTSGGTKSSSSIIGNY